MSDTLLDGEDAERLIERIVEIQREFFFENKGKETERRRKLREIIEQATPSAEA